MTVTEVERAMLWTAGRVRRELLAEVKDFGRLKHLIEQLERFEAINAYPQLGGVEDHVIEGPVLSCWIMPTVPHVSWTGDASVSYVVPGPSVWQEEVERKKLEAEVTQELPAATAAAKARLVAYRVAYTALVEARLAHIVDFAMGRYDEADRNHGTSRKRRPAEREAAMLAAHQIAADYGDVVRKALLGISMEHLHRQRMCWGEMSYEKNTPDVFGQACLPLTTALVEWIEDQGLESRPLIGVVNTSGALEANIIINASRWEKGPNNVRLASQPMVEWRALLYAASQVRQPDYEVAGAA